MNSSAHVPVLLNEAVQALNLSQSQVVVDATYGRGGHSRAIFDALPAKARLIVIDRDQDAVDHGLAQWKDEPQIEVVNAPFSELTHILDQRVLIGEVDAILFDFGVSSPQLDQAQRGFSFSHDGPLDMRMDQSRGVPAATWIRRVEEDELVKVLKEFGEERFARRIARKIKTTLLENEIDSTHMLARIICDAIPFREKGKHPATRTFQAIRIAVNSELQEIKTVLPQALDALTPGGRMVVISFHSLEDRIVKRFFRDQSRGDPYPVDLPVTSDMLKPKLRLVGKLVKPTQGELKINPRARSAVMRVAQKTAA